MRALKSFAALAGLDQAEPVGFLAFDQGGADFSRDSLICLARCGYRTDCLCLLGPSNAAPTNDVGRLHVAAVSQHAGKRVAFESVAKLEILTEHVEALVPSQALELGGVHAAVHAGGQRAALEAVAA